MSHQLKEWSRTAVDKRRRMGFGMIEFLIALTVFTAGMLGLLSAQLSGQRSTQAALDRSLASSLAADLLARIELNPEQVSSYSAQAATLAEHQPSTPPVDCYSTPCTPEDMALFDWWEWSGRFSADRGPVLPDARVCVVQDAGIASVEISWRGGLSLIAPHPLSCAGGDVGGASLRRHVLFSTFTGSP